MCRIIVLFSLLLLVGCADAGSFSGSPADFFANTGPLSGKYDGTDAGYLITTITARSDTSYGAYSLFFGKKDRSTRSGIWWGQTNIYDRRKLDIDDGKETGIVDVRRLPPGDYEFYNFEIALTGNLADKKWSASRSFSIPFTIQPGRATYVGEFMAVGLHSKSWLGLSEPDGAYFVLSDEMKRDAAIARQKEPSLSEVTSAVVDPNKIGNPLISATVH